MAISQSSLGNWPPSRKRGFPGHLARHDQHVHEQIDHHRRADEVEHDGGDDDVTAPLGLQPGWDQRPGGAEDRRATTAKGIVTYQGT
jgi:hypothetical protein